MATEREQPLVSLAPGGTVALEFNDARHAQQQLIAFNERFPIHAVVGVDDDTTVLAAQAAQALGLPHNSVASVKAARYKDVMRLALSEAGLPSPDFWVVATDEDARRVSDRVRYPCVL